MPAGRDPALPMTTKVKCVGCGCSETKACVRNAGKPDEERCGWATTDPPVCTFCQEKADAAANLHSPAELESDAKRLAEILDDELADGVAFLVFCFTPQNPTKLTGLSNAKIEDQLEAAYAWIGHAGGIILP